MLNIHAKISIHLACGITDLRKSVDGLTAIIQENFKLDPFTSELFVFCNRDRTKLKILHWENTGFWLYYRRLETGRFKWPPNNNELSKISREELSQLLEGLLLIKHQKKLDAVKSRILH